MNTDVASMPAWRPEWLPSLKNWTTQKRNLLSAHMGAGGFHAQDASDMTELTRLLTLLETVASPASSAGVGVGVEIAERVAVLTAHRACHGTEHDPANGRLHGCCIVCGIPFPCEYVRPAPTPSQHPAAPSVSPAVAGDGLPDEREVRRLQSCEQAWKAVFDLLCELAPGWYDNDMTGHEAALATIRRLATAEQPGSAVQGDDLFRDDWISPAELEKRLDVLAEEYEWGGDENITITERERMLLIDFAHGIMADEIFVAMMKAHHDLNAKDRPTAPPPAPAAEQGDLRKFYEAKAAGLGWNKADSEGCVEFLMRRAYETGHEDAVSQRATRGPHEDRPEARGVEELKVLALEIFQRAGNNNAAYHRSWAKRLKNIYNTLVTSNPVRAEQPQGEMVLVPREAVAQAAAALDVMGRRPLAAWLMKEASAAPSRPVVDDAMVERFCVAFLGGEFPTKATHNDNAIRAQVRDALTDAFEQQGDGNG